MHDASNNTVGLELPQLLREHLLRGRWDCAFESREAQNSAAEQTKQDFQLPASADHLQRLLDPVRCGRRSPRFLTWR